MQNGLSTLQIRIKHTGDDVTQIIPMSFRFKGNRDYIHGPDIYNEMIRSVATHYGRDGLGKLRLTMRKFATKQCDMTFGDLQDTPLISKRIVSELIIDTDRGREMFRLVETDKPIHERYNFDESLIENISKIDNHRIILAQDSGYSEIEIAVSLTKQLHNNFFPSDNARWIVTMVDLDKPLSKQYGAISSVKFEQGFGDRLTRSQIMSGDTILGRIYFSLVGK